jgi:Ca2+-binding EF-hand superfamily protein
VALVGSVSAQQTGPADAGRNDRPKVVDRLFQRLDTDKDGSISKEELTAAGNRLFQIADSNHDGIVTPLELRKARLALMREWRGGNGGLAARDTNHDGEITRDEYMAVPAATFARLDKNGDGKLDQSEITAAQTEMQQRTQQMRERFAQRWRAWRDERSARHDDRRGDGHHGWHRRDERRADRQDDDSGRRGHHWWHRDGRGDRNGSDAAARRGDRQGWFGPGIIRRIDTDGDGAISRAELTAAADRLLERLDTDKDGKISRAEAEAGFAAMRNGPR